MTKIISDEAINTRNYWVTKIVGFSKDFSSNSELIEKELDKEIKKKGIIYIMPQRYKKPFGVIYLYVLISINLLLIDKE